MIRLVVAVALTVAIVGMAAPALEQGAIYRSEAVLGHDLERIASAADELATHEEPLDVGQGPRRVHTVRLPASGLVWGEVATVAIGEPLSGPGNGSVIRYRVRGGPEHRIPLEIPLRGPAGEPIVWNGPGDRTVALTLEGPRTAPIVRIRER